MKIRITPDLLQKIPGIRVGALVIKNIKNNRKNSVVAGLLRGVCAEKKREMANEAKKEKIEHLLNQTMDERQILTETALLDSMLRKIHQGKEPKSENNARDIGHFLSLKYFTPALGRDLDQTEKDIEIGFVTPKKGKKAVDFDYLPETQHVVLWFVDIGARDKEFFETLPEEFVKIFVKYCGGTVSESILLNVDNPEAELNYISEKETQYKIEMAKKAEEDARRAAEKAAKDAERAAGEAELAAEEARREKENSSKKGGKSGSRRGAGPRGGADSGDTPFPETFEPILKHILEKEVSKAVTGLCDQLSFCSKLFYEPVKLETPKSKSHGDYACSSPLKLAKSINKTPKEVAEMIQKNLPQLPYIDKVEFADPGFLNFTISQTYLQEELQKILTLKEHYGRLNLGEAKKAMIDFSSPNVAKPLGAHHLLSTLIGQALCNILEFCNYRVIGANFLGDWGTQFGKLMVAFKTWGDRATIQKDPINELLKLYVKFHDEAEKDPSLEDKGREEFKKLEEGDEQNRNLLTWFREESLKDLERVYQKLGVHFQEYLPESMYEAHTKEIIEEGKAKGVFVEGEKGATVVKFENEEFPPYLIQKADGATLYSTRDIASIKDRIERFHPAKLLYVVDVAQSLHFNQLFATAKKLGYTEPEYQHIVFGRMNFPEGGMSTRKGTVILVEDLLKEATERAAKVINEKSQALTDAEKQFITEGVAVGAIKYHVLSQNRETNLTFDWDRMLALDGNTAPYLQYSFARAESILRKAQEAGMTAPGGPPRQGGGAQMEAPKADMEQKSHSLPSGIDETQTDLFTLVAEKTQTQAEADEAASARAAGDTAAFSHPSELSLARLLAKFPEIIEAAAETYKPSMICTYLFDLSQDFNAFYQEVQVLTTQDETQRQNLLTLVAAFSQVIKNGLHLLGITAFEKM